MSKVKTRWQSLILHWPSEDPALCPLKQEEHCWALLRFWGCWQRPLDSLTRCNQKTSLTVTHFGMARSFKKVRSGLQIVIQCQGDRFLSTIALIAMETMRAGEKAPTFTT